MNDWKHKDEWHKSGTNFLIVVKRHDVELSEFDHGEGPHRWAVYAYIYPDHPHFAAFDGPHMWQDATAALPLHGCASLLEYPMYEGKVTSVKVGADYHHLHDDRFSHYANTDEAHEVFHDAEDLHAKLTTLSIQGTP